MLSRGSGSVTTTWGRGIGHRLLTYPEPAARGSGPPVFQPPACVQADGLGDAAETVPFQQLHEPPVNPAGQTGAAVDQGRVDLHQRGPGPDPFVSISG